MAKGSGGGTGVGGGAQYLAVMTVAVRGPMVAATVISVATHELTEGMVQGRSSHGQRYAAETETEHSPRSKSSCDSAILVGQPLSLLLLSPQESASNPPFCFSKFAP